MKNHRRGNLTRRLNIIEQRLVRGQTAVAEHAQAEKTLRDDDLLSRAQVLHEEALGQLAAAKADGRPRDALLAIREASSTLRLLGEVLGEIRSATLENVTLVESQDWISLQARILQALAGFPEARAAILAAIGEDLAPGPSRALAGPATASAADPDALAEFERRNAAAVAESEEYRRRMGLPECLAEIEEARSDPRGHCERRGTEREGGESSSKPGGRGLRITPNEGQSRDPGPFVKRDSPETREPVDAERRRELVAGCLDGILMWCRVVPDAGDPMVRGLAEELSITVEEAGALVAEEMNRRLAVGG